MVLIPTTPTLHCINIKPRDTLYGPMPYNFSVCFQPIRRQFMLSLFQRVQFLIESCMVKKKSKIKHIHTSYRSRMCVNPVVCISYLLFSSCLLRTPSLLTFVCCHSGSGDRECLLSYPFQHTKVSFPGFFSCVTFIFKTYPIVITCIY